jgi:hypothetical protein
MEIFHKSMTHKIIFPKYIFLHTAIKIHSLPLHQTAGHMAAKTQNITHPGDRSFHKTSKLILNMLHNYVRKVGRVSRT